MAYRGTFELAYRSTTPEAVYQRTLAVTGDPTEAAKNKQEAIAAHIAAGLET